ncbi:MAG: glycosyltransferase family 1 protein [Patescibacteria group bacterium]|nr:glycosyltransferase family 1 protein [Patescibacteria group bacterium]
MKVGLDLRCLPSDGSEGAGVAHAARALCSQLIKEKPINWQAFVVKGSAWQASPKYELADGQSKTLKKALGENPCDILFVPSGAVSYGLDIPAIPWVHDLIIFDHPEWFPESWLHRQLTTHLFLRGIKQAPIVFAVSEYTKQAIIRHARVTQEKVMVTHEGGDGQLTINNEQLTIKKSASEYCRGKWGIEGQFILALGTVEPRKNLAMLIRAWKKSGGALDLVIAGRNGWKFEDVTREIKSLTSDEASRFHRIEDFNDDDKRQLLLAASIVAVPSLDEGFGLVALEALQAGTDVVASNRGALPEIVGQAGILLDPEDEKAWAEALNRISKLESRSSSTEQAQKFNWEKTAGVVLEGLKKL